MGAMQLLFAAPFLLAAALAFTILAVIPPWRRWALPIPSGILASGPSLFATLGAELLVAHLLGHDNGPAPPRAVLLSGLSIAVLGGILGGVAAGVIARLLAATLPRLLLRMAVLVSAWCSDFVLLIALNIAVSARWPLPDTGALPIAEALLALIPAWFTARNPDPFRSSLLRLPIGLRFRQRTEEVVSDN